MDIQGAPRRRTWRAAVNLAPPPVARGLVTRERLLRWLGTSPGVPLIVVTGGAGFGKSTLLVAWASRLREPVAWLTIDPEDADPQQFAANLVRAIERVVPGTCEAAAALLGRLDPSPPIDIGRALADDLACLPHDLVVIIDDAHLLAAGEAVQVLDGLLARPPAPLHLVLAGRETPPLAPLGRLRLLGLASELGEAALRFTPEEAGRLIGEAADRADPADLARALARIDGWPAGVRLLRLRLQDAAAMPAAPLAAVAAIGENLAAEVLDREPSAAAFLEPLAVLSHVTAGMAAEMGDGGDPGEAAAMLADLVSRHLFVAQDAGDPRIFRLHGLLREALLARLRAREGDRAVAALHRRAAACLIAREEIDAAIVHLIDAGDLAAVIDLLAEQGIDLLARDDWSQVRRWLARVPAEAAAASPELLVLRAHVERNQGDFAAARASLERAAALLEQEPPGSRRNRWRWEIVALRCRAEAMAGAVEGVETAAAEVMDAPEASWLARSYAVFAWILALQRQGRFAAAAEGADRFLAGPWGRNDAVETYAALGRLSLAIASADISAALAFAQGAADAGDRGGFPRGVKWGCAARACLLLDLNDLDGAEAAARRAIAIAPGEYLGAELEAVSALAATLAARGRHAAAAEVVLDERRRLGAPLPASARAAFAAMQARLAVAAGERPDPAWLAEAAADVAAPPTQVAPRGASIAAAALLAEGPARAADALAVIDAALAAAREQHAGLVAARLGPMRALALAGLGRREEALDALDEALRADPALVRRFLDLGQPMADLLAAAAAERPALRVRVAPALAAFSRPTAADTPPVAAVLPAPTPGLTRRERQVLERFARHLTNEEIARELNIAEETVKQHASSLLRKIGVSNRREAARMAPAWLAASREG